MLEGSTLEKRDGLDINAQTAVNTPFSWQPSSRTLVLGLLGIFISFVCFAFYLATRPHVVPTQTSQTAQLSKNPNSSREPKECPPATARSQKDFEFVDTQVISDQAEKDKIFFALNDKTYLRNRYSITEPIVQMVYAPKLQKIIYLTGEDVFENKDHQRHVKILNLRDGTTKDIFSYRTRLFENNEPKNLALDLDALRSISLSPDDTKLMIITDKELFRYDLQYQKFDFSHKGKVGDGTFVDHKGDRHYFNTAIISPDNNKAVLSNGFYEGVSYYLLDFATQKITSLEMGGYGSGTFAEGWFKDDILHYDTEQDSILCARSLSPIRQTCFPNPMKQSSWPTKVTVIGNEVYVLAERVDTSIIQKTCNNVGTIFDTSPKYDSLMVYSPAEKTQREVLHVDSTEVSGLVLHSKILQFAEFAFQGKKQLVLQLQDADKQIVYGVLDPELPEKITKLEFR